MCNSSFESVIIIIKGVSRSIATTTTFLHFTLCIENFLHFSISTVLRSCSILSARRYLSRFLVRFESTLELLMLPSIPSDLHTRPANLILLLYMVSIILAPSYNSFNPLFVLKYIKIKPLVSNLASRAEDSICGLECKLRKNRIQNVALCAPVNSHGPNWPRRDPLAAFGSDSTNASAPLLSNKT